MAAAPIDRDSHVGGRDGVGGCDGCRGASAAGGGSAEVVAAVLPPTQSGGGGKGGGPSQAPQVAKDESVPRAPPRSPSPTR